MNPDKKGKKNIEIVTGTGENLDISVVSTHVAACKPKINKIIVFLFHTYLYFFLTPFFLIFFPNNLSHIIYYDLSFPINSL